MDKLEMFKKQGRKIQRFLSVGMAAILVLLPITGEEASAKTAVPALTKSVSVNKGKTKTITISKQGVTIKKVTWKSSNKKVATVKAAGKSKGKVTAVKKGTATITATVSYNYKKKNRKKILTCKVTVKEAGASHGKVIASGTCGKKKAGDVKWRFYADRTLYIYGKGDMKDFCSDWVVQVSSQDVAPWKEKYTNKLKKVEIATGVTSIGEEAFSGCSSLVSIRIPKSVTSIGSAAFLACSSLAGIRIPEGVTSIGMGAFRQCSSLASIRIPESVTSIGEYAFMYCESLASITIPEGVTSIGDCAFSECSSLKSITWKGVTYNSLEEFEDAWQNSDE